MNRHGQAIGAAALVLLLIACNKPETEVIPLRQIDIPASLHLNAIWFADSLHGSIAAGNNWTGGAVYSTFDGGQTWQTDTTTLRELSCMMYDRDGRGYACGLDGQALHRPPGSRHWIPFRYDYGWYRSAFFWDEQTGVIAGGESVGRGYAVNFGPDFFWQKDTLTLFPNELTAVWATDRNTWFAAGYGWLMRSDNAGHTWERLPPTDDFFCDIHFPSAQTGYLCGQYGSIWKTTDGGFHWDRLRKVHGQARFSALWFTDDENGWLTGEKGLFWHTTDGGHHWSEIAGIDDAVYLKSVFVRGNDGWLTGENGQLWHFLTK